MYNDTKERDTHRYYWSSKMAKDFVMLAGKDEFSYQEVESYFNDKVILNYLNEMVLTSIETFERVLIEKGGIKEAFFDEHFPEHMAKVPWLRKLKRMSKFIDMDNIYFQLAEVAEQNNTKVFRENLSDYQDFRTEEYVYTPILDPRVRKELTVDYFRSLQEPYIIQESDFDHISMDEDTKELVWDARERKERRVRRSPLAHDTGLGDT